MTTPTFTDTQIMHFDPAELGLDVDWVLQGQGIDPQTARSHHPRLVDLAERAFADGLPMLQPVAAVRTFEVSGWTHNKVNLQPQGSLSGDAIRQHLIKANQIAVLVYSIGGEVEQRVSAEMSRNGAYAIALDGLANAAVDALGGVIYHRLESIARQSDWNLSIFLSPGMAGWSVEEGQPQVVRLLDPALIGLKITPAWMIAPQKSSSAVLGMGKMLETGSTLPCDYCTLQGTCHYHGRMHDG